MWGYLKKKHMHTFDVSCKIILDEVVNKLPVIGLKFDTCRRYGVFFSDVCASLPDLEAHIKLRQVFTSSRQEYCTMDGVEQKITVRPSGYCQLTSLKHMGITSSE
jgi:hypothetical protein